MDEDITGYPMNQLNHSLSQPLVAPAWCMVVAFSAYAAIFALLLVAARAMP